jgi:hypothetical protein
MGGREMNLALVRKEVRELLPWMVLVGLLQLYLVSSAMGVHLGFLQQSPQTIPFINDELCSYMFTVAGIFAAVIGFWQTAWESSRGTFLFLLHRPIHRDAIVFAKLAVGITVCLIAPALPVLIYARWAATPGTHASPFLWSMTGWAWMLVLEIPLVYLGAFLSGLRPAKWYGTRLLPFAASLLLLFATQGPPWGITINLVLTLIGYVLFFIAIFQVAMQRDYS